MGSAPPGKPDAVRRCDHLSWCEPLLLVGAALSNADAVERWGCCRTTLEDLLHPSEAKFAGDSCLARWTFPGHSLGRQRNATHRNSLGASPSRRDRIRFVVQAAVAGHGSDRLHRRAARLASRRPSRSDLLSSWRGDTNALSSTFAVVPTGRGAASFQPTSKSLCASRTSSSCPVC